MVARRDPAESTPGPRAPSQKQRGFSSRTSMDALSVMRSGPLYGTSPDEPDALAIRSGRLLHRHFIVHAGAIERIDEGSHAIGLRLQRAELQRFF